MNYVVTGGAGFIGSHIVEELVRQKHDVVIIDNLFSGKLENIQPFLKHKKVRFVQGSITDLPLLKKSFKGADGVFHEAAIASVPYSVANPDETHGVNLTGTLNVLIAARESGAKNILFASSAAVYGDRPVFPKQEEMSPDLLSPYAVSKLAGENYCSVFSRLYGMRCVSLRYFNVFGPRQDPASPYSGVITKFITGTLANRPLRIFGDGKQTRDFVYVKDVVQANLSAMKHGAPDVYNIARGERIDLLGLVSLIAQVTGITVPITFAPPAQGDVRDSVADISRARDAFDYTPEYTIEAGLKETIAWFRKQNPA